MELEKDPEVIFARLLEEEVFEEIPQQPYSVRATLEFTENLKMAIDVLDEDGIEDGCESEDEVRMKILIRAYLGHMYERRTVTMEEISEAVAYLKAYYEVNRDKRLEEWSMRMRLR